MSRDWTRFWYIPGLMAHLREVDKVLVSHDERLTAQENETGDIRNIMSQVEDDLKSANDAIDAHNVADGKYKQDVIQRLTTLEQQVATGASTPTLLALVADLKAKTGAMPTMDLTKDDPANQAATVNVNPAPVPAATDTTAAPADPAVDTTAPAATTTTPTGGAPTS